VESLVSLSWCIRQDTRGEGDGDADYLPPHNLLKICKTCQFQTVFFMYKFFPFRDYDPFLIAILPMIVLSTITTHAIPSIRTTIRQRTIKYQDSIVWNKLPLEIQESSSIPASKNTINTSLIIISIWILTVFVVFINIFSFFLAHSITVSSLWKCSYYKWGSWALTESKIQSLIIFSSQHHYMLFFVYTDIFCVICSINRYVMCTMMTNKYSDSNIYKKGQVSK